MATEEKPQLNDLVFDLIRQFATGADGEPVNGETVLRDIGFDSLSYAELGATLELERGVDIADYGLCMAKTAAEIVDVVERTATPRPPADVFPTGMGRMQRAAKTVAGALFRWWFNLEIHGAANVPRTGPLILAMNHESMLDIPLTVVASPRPVTFMAKRELFEGKVGARFFHELGGFSVEREAFDLRAVEISLEVIRRGDMLG